MHDWTKAFGDIPLGHAQVFAFFNIDGNAGTKGVDARDEVVWFCKMLLALKSAKVDMVASGSEYPADLKDRRYLGQRYSRTAFGVVDLPALVKPPAVATTSMRHEAGSEASIRVDIGIETG